MAPKLYYIPESGPCRTVIMTAKILGIDLDLKYLDLMKGEHLTPEFLKINPCHAVPTLTDGDITLIESRCIMTYLVEKYGKDDSLYPKDPKKRALINQKLYFDIGTLYAAVVDCYGVIYSGAKSFDDSKMPSVHKGFEFLNTFLKNSKFAVGDTLTVADIALISTVTSAIAVFDLDLKPYPNIQQWFETVKSSLPDYKGIIEENCKKFRVFVDVVVAKNNQV